MLSLRLHCACVAAPRWGHSSRIRWQRGIVSSLVAEVILCVFVFCSWVSTGTFTGTFTVSGAWQSRCCHLKRLRDRRGIHAMNCAADGSITRQNESLQGGILPSNRSLETNETAKTNTVSSLGRGRIAGQKRGRPPQTEGKSLQISDWMPDVTNITIESRRSAGLVAIAALAGAAGGFMASRGSGPLGVPSTSLQDDSFNMVAYSDPVIRQGSVLLSRPGMKFSKQQIYFHKSVILIIEHRFDGFDQGLILNRPMDAATTDLGISGPPLQTIFGGDVEGLSDLASGYENPAYFCVHLLEQFASQSTEITRGVYWMELKNAQQLVAQGRARAADFFLVLGYAGWGRGQLQRELDRGDWKLASVDSRIIIQELRREMAELRAMSQLGLDDGIASWRHLYAVVDADAPRRNPEDLMGDRLADELLRNWKEVHLE